MVAAQTGNLEIVKLLIQFNASVNAKCYDPEVTALYIAAIKGHNEVFEYLFSLINCPQQREYALKELPDGIIRKQRREDKLTTNFISAAARGNIQGVEKAIEAGVSISAFGERGETALHKASGNGHMEVVRFLLEAGANVEFLSEGGITPLQEAVTSGNADTVKVLLEAGANLHVKDDSDRTFLMLAVDRNNIAIVKVLLDAGIEINAESDRGDPALEIARRVKYREMIQFLKEAGAVGNSDIEINPDEIGF